MEKLNHVTCEKASFPSMDVKANVRRLVDVGMYVVVASVVGSHEQTHSQRMNLIICTQCDLNLGVDALGGIYDTQL